MMSLELNPQFVLAVGESGKTDWEDLRFESLLGLKTGLQAG